MPAQRKFKTVLPRRSAVAGARAASVFCEHRLHMIAETPLKRLVELLDLYLSGGRRLPGFHGDCGFAVFERDQNPIRDLRH